jgi:glutathione S-transferase
MRLPAVCLIFPDPVSLPPETLRWISWGTHHLTRAADAFYFESLIAPRYMGRAPNAELLKSSAREFHRFAPILDDYLSGRT